MFLTSMLNLQTIRSTRGSINNLGTGLRRGHGNAALRYRKTRPDKAAAQPDPLKTHANGAFDYAVQWALSPPVTP
jgi:hypothetical protein